MATIEQAREVFGKTAKTYDIGNRIISAGMDVVWRRGMASSCARLKPRRVLDVACGTGDVVFDIARYSKEKPFFVGIDVTESMLLIAQKKDEEKKTRSTWMMADGIRLPFHKATFDAITISWGLRNLPAREPFFREACRVLKRGGRVWILEFSQPKPGWFRQFYYFYFTHIMPRLGGLVAGRALPYTYLADTVKHWPESETVRREMERNGFKEVKVRSIWRGIAAIHTGVAA